MSRDWSVRRARPVNRKLIWRGLLAVQFEGHGDVFFGFDSLTAD
jgi:hypothetical protein